MRSSILVSLCNFERVGIDKYLFIVSMLGTYLIVTISAFVVGLLL